ncbi:MAG TPA: helix-turn-helix domain-containing protein [Pirellula sp.]|nr:helix-turn-helix domain-containing protein [Pirellula sp.]
MCAKQSTLSIVLAVARMVTACGRPLMIEDFPSLQPLNESGPSKSKIDTAVAAFLEELITQQELSALGLHEILLSVVEPAMLQIVLRQTGGNRLKAAEVLGIHRSTLRERLCHYDLDD